MSISRDVEDAIASAGALSSPCLDLSKRSISDIPLPLPDLSKLERLYLAGNCLKTLPDALFACLPNLKWLDLRNNRLISLPLSVDRLHSLRTLLLEGNRLTTLPPQLGLLLQLDGLNLVGNPLQSPPQRVVEGGTRAVLLYLRQVYTAGLEAEGRPAGDIPLIQEVECLIPEEDDFSSQPHDSLTDSLQRHNPQAIPPSSSFKSVLPRPLHYPAPLHTPPDLRHPARVGTPSPTSSGKVSRQGGRRKQPPSREVSTEKNGRGQRSGGVQAVRPSQKMAERQWTPRELSVREKQEVSVALDKQRSKQSLAAWQEEARRKQRCPHCNASEAHSKSVGPAPFATGTPEPREQGQHEAAERECSGRSRGGGQWDASQGERVQRYVAELRGQRVQGGLVGQPSQELLEAEQRLAEAMAQREEFESRKAQEYRLIAFTGDLPLGTL